MDMKKNDKRFKLRYSKAAQVLIENITEDFPIESFEKWVSKNMFVVGDGYITAYLAARKKLKQNVISKVTNKQ